MLKTGNVNRLEIVEIRKDGVSLADGEGGEIWLPRRELSRDYRVGETIDVFIGHDSELELTATTKLPYAEVGEFAHLRVTSIQSVGAFLDWGLPKDLFLPFREQTRELREGHDVIVFIYLDNTGRIAASMRLEKYIDRTPTPYREGEEVSLFIISETDLGFKAVIDGRYLGVLYRNEIFQPLHIGQNIRGYIHRIRDDEKIDLILEATGHRAAADIGTKILDLLEKRGGFLPVGDKASAEVIYDLFGVSKKKYKMALGGLYKKQLVFLENDGVRLRRK